MNQGRVGSSYLLDSWCLMHRLATGSREECDRWLSELNSAVTDAKATLEREYTRSRCLRWRSRMSVLFASFPVQVFAPVLFLRMNSCRQICPVLFATVSLKASYPAPKVRQTVDIPMQVMTSLLILANFITNIWDAETRSERGQEAFHVAIEGGAAVLFCQSRCEMHGLVNTYLFVTRTQGFLIQRRKSMITAFLISSKSPSQ